jgi:hypothetical protein
MIVRCSVARMRGCKPIGAHIYNRSIHVYQLPFSEEELTNAIHNTISLNNKQHDPNHNWITESDKSTL